MSTRRGVLTALVITALMAAGVVREATAQSLQVCLNKKGTKAQLRTTCKQRETAIDLAQIGAVGPTGPQGPQGAQGPAGPQGDPGPTAASYGMRTPSSISTSQTPEAIVALTQAEETGGGGGRITVTEPSRLQIMAAIEMHHGGGTADLPLGISCQALYDDGTNVFEAGQPTRMEVFGQSNHNAYVTMPVVANVEVEAGTYDVRIDCRNGFPEDFNPGVRRIDAASLNVIAVRRP